MRTENENITMIVQEFHQIGHQARAAKLKCQEEQRRDSIIPNENTMNKTELIPVTVELPERHPIVTATATLPEDIRKQLRQAFGPMAIQEAAWEAEAAAIVVTDASHTEAMAQARALRLKFKAARCDAEAERKRLKAGYLEGGRAVDGVAKLITEPCARIEESLAAKEEFVERKEAAEKLSRSIDRARELGSMGIDLALYTSQMDVFTDAQWSTFIQGQKDAREAARKRTAAQAEADRIERERVAKLEEENRRIAAEALVEKRRLEQEAAAARVAKFKAEQALNAERDAMEKALNSERAKAAQVAEQAARAERERKNAELRATELKRQQESAAAMVRMAEEKRREEAPDAENLRAYIDELSRVNTPSMKTERGAAALKYIIAGICGASQMVAEMEVRNER